MERSGKCLRNSSARDMNLHLLCCADRGYVRWILWDVLKRWCLIDWKKSKASNHVASVCVLHPTSGFPLVADFHYWQVGKESSNVGWEVKLIFWEAIFRSERKWNWKKGVLERFQSEVKQSSRMEVNVLLFAPLSTPHTFSCHIVDTQCAVNVLFVCFCLNA